jgi:hypothetical protein
MIEFQSALDEQVLVRKVVNELKELEQCGIPVNQGIYKRLHTMRSDPMWIDLSEYDNMSVSEIADLLRELYI